jgi:hypothetical protein
MTQDDWIAAIADTARDWQNPDYEPRATAVEVTLEASNRTTQEGLAFALNHRMQQFKPEALRTWIDGREAPQAKDVGVVCAEAPPLDGLVATVAALVLGHRVWVAPSEASPSLVQAFFADVLGGVDDAPARFVPRPSVFERADVLVASGDAERLDALAEAADAAGIPADRRWLHRPGMAVAVIDGREEAEARSGLAEDLLLHEGVGPRAPSLLWAPAGLAPDALLDTLAGFRELYPPHPDTDGTLAMPTAFLSSAKQAHATGPGFLVSKGAPEPQAPGHIRWVEYADVAEVAGWLREHARDVAFVVARPHPAEQIEASVRFVEPGDAHRPSLGDEVPGLVAVLTS